jgi:hypothetical protein
MPLTFMRAHNADTLEFSAGGYLQMRHATALSLVIATMCASGAVAAGDIYCNNQGKDCSDRPSPNATVVHVTSAPSAGNDADTAPKTPIDADANARLKEDATRKAVQKDVAATRAEQCKKATERYQRSITARHAYRLNKDGERQYLTDAEIDQERLDARHEMDQFCANPGS